MICPNCSAGEISPLTHRCELCGFAGDGAVAVAAAQPPKLDELARLELAERFRLGAFLGRGAASIVYLAREPDSKRDLVVKVFARPAENRAQVDERFAQAVDAVAALEHPHIVPVFAHGVTEHVRWYSMEFVRGGSLREYLAAHGPMELKACQRLIAQVASALDHAHRRGIVHGTLTPGNVLIDAEGWVHVCDVLVSLALGPSAPPVLPGAMSVAAPPPPPEPEAPRPAARSPYRAPEKLCTASSDQYALAALVYECLAGSPPPVRKAGLDAAPLTLPGRPDVPAAVCDAVQKAMSPKSRDRFDGVLDFMAAFDVRTPSAPDMRVPARTTPTVLTLPHWQPPEPVGRWKRTVVAGLGVAAIILLAFPLRPAVRQLMDRVLRPSAPPAVMVSDSAARPAPPPAPTDTASPAPAPPARAAAPPATRAAPQAGNAAPRSRDAGPRRDAAPRARDRTARQAAPPPPPPAAAPGQLFVNASPWGQLYIDGQLIGNTPRANVSVAAGSHTIRVEREGFERFERTIQVASGEVVRMTDIVLVPRKP